jgi:adenosylhomocysteine nucleosidase
MPDRRPAVVVTAIPEEIAPLLSALPVSVDRLDGRKVFTTRATWPPLVLAATGDGPRNALDGASRLCEAYRPAALIGLGAAGALTPTLSPLDLVSSMSLRNGSGEVPPPDRILRRLAADAGARPATLVTTAAPVVSAEHRRALAEGAGDVAAVDMESSGWARGAARWGVPFVVVRAISDGASEELPEYLPECVGDDGGIRRSAVLAQALRRPATVPALLRLRRRVGACADRLAAFLLNRFIFH